MTDSDDEMGEAFGKRSKRKATDFGEEYRAKVHYLFYSTTTKYRSVAKIVNFVMWLFSFSFA